MKDKIRLKWIVKYSKEWLSIEEIRAILSLVGIKDRDRLIIKTLYEGGLRISELLKTKTKHVRMEDGFAFILLQEKQKNKLEWIPQPISENLYNDLKSYINSEKIQDEEYIFHNKSDPGAHLNRMTIYKMLKKLAKQAGVKKQITTHSFRRTRAKLLLDAGMNLFHVKETLRHKSVTSTQKYLEISKRELAEQIKKQDKKIEGFE